MAQVLLIEPDRILAKTYLSALEQAGHRVQVCASAQAGIFCADEIPPDVVIIELQLVGHSGIEFLYEFRSYPDWQQVPVVIHTSVPAADFSCSWQLLRDELGISNYHYKPLTTLKQLIASLESSLVVTAPVS